MGTPTRGFHHVLDNQHREDKMKEQILISTSARSYGYGRAPWKWVSGLTKEERQALKSGNGVVLYDDFTLSGGTHGHPIKQAIYRNGRYLRRVASPELVEKYHQIYK